MRNSESGSCERLPVRRRLVESGMATAEYATGLLGALVIAATLYKLSVDDDSFFAGIFKSLYEHLQDAIRGMIRAWQRIG